MSLKPFTYPFPETRFLHAGPNVYKFKIRYGNSIRGEDIENKEVIVQELEDSIRVVLGNLDNLQPFATEHFIVFPYKSKWERVSHLKFKHGEIVLVPYPFVFTLYVEMKWFHENLSPGEPINDSPPGLVLAERKAAGAMTRKRKRVEVPSSPSRPALDRTKMGISSQGPSKKKPLMDTRRNGERKTQQEWQDTPTFNTTDIQEQALSSPSAISSEGAASEPSRCSREACPLALTSHSVLCHGERGLQTPGVPLWVCLILCPFTMDFFFFFNLKH
ncbi:membrane-anchored junction protein isoform X1 [Mustela erminea]|uniref:membrane-anchored junction protein isoform X1 n=1 Tax=Mustela erminea TaxID=36723 RepID=UPI0013871A7A|nr:membrane-anchored junction protein isoform X1 [Mustela erminea]XP_032213139.1 membrane-anchored junction protein isoform X1 [Mustela erminea]XP_032213140.1 membrane-anchored junction protein isoform X1 [Mustela erminea]